MKIKTKKKMSPEEYAKYMIDKHGISSLMSELIDDNIIDAPKRYSLTFELNPVPMKEISDTDFGNKEFTVEVEEELTGDTEIPEMLILDNDGSTRVRKNHHTSYYRAIDTKALYLINDDMTMTLIWKNGRLVK